MLIELTTAILDALKASGLDVREISAKDLLDKTINLTRPAVDITINDATSKQVTMWEYKVIPTISLIVVFQTLKGGASGEFRRKEGVYKILEAITNTLVMQDLGLALENPILPRGFRNITTTEYARAGYQIYKLDFWCSYNVDFQDHGDKDLGELKSIMATYYLPPNDTSDTTRASDIVDLT